MPGVIDLGQYLRVLLRWSWIIILFALLGAAAGAYLAMTRDATYESTATLLVKPAPEGLSVSAQNRTGVIDPDLRSVTLPDVPVRSLALISNTSTPVETAVVKQLGDQLPPDLRKPGELRKQVMVSEVAGRPDVLVATATMRDRALTMRVANLWANQTALQLNSLLGRGFYDPERAAPEIQQAQQRLAQAQAALGKFEQNPRVVEVARQVETRQDLLSSLSEQSNRVKQNLDNAVLLRPTLQGNRGGQGTSLPLSLITLTTFAVVEADVDVSRFLPSLSAQADPGTDNLSSDQGSAPARQSDTVQIQPIVQAVGALNAREQRSFLESLIVLLTQKQAQLQKDINNLDREVAVLRSQWTELEAQRYTLETNMRSERQVYENLIMIDRQQRVTARIQSDKVAVVGQAVEAMRTDFRGILPPLLGVVAGGLIGTLLAFLMEFARRPRPGVAGSRSVTTAS